MPAVSNGSATMSALLVLIFVSQSVTTDVSPATLLVPAAVSERVARIVIVLSEDFRRARSATSIS